MKKIKTGFVMTALALLVLVLGVLVLYAFVIKPSLNGYVVNAQNQGVNATMNYILNQLQQQGYVSFNVGNQTLILVPYRPPANQTSQQG